MITNIRDIAYLMFRINGLDEWRVVGCRPEGLP